MGTRGPVPKRSDERRRRNGKTSDDAPKGADRPGAPHAEQPPTDTAPEADETWHPIARAWYESLTRSAQTRYYQPSDWHTAFLIAESISRDLSPQAIGIDERTGEVVRDVIPLKGASLAAYLKACSVLLVTEGDRRRLGVELEARRGADPDAERAAGVVTDIRSRLTKSG